MKYIFSESQLRNLIDKEIDEGLAPLRYPEKKRLFPKNIMMSNPDGLKNTIRKLKI